MSRGNSVVGVFGDRETPYANLSVCLEVRIKMSTIEMVSPSVSRSNHESTIECCRSAVAALSGVSVESMSSALQPPSEEEYLSIDHLFELFRSAGLPNVELRTFFHDELDRLEVEVLDRLSPGEAIGFAFDHDDGGSAMLVVTRNEYSDLIGLDYRSTPPTTILNPSEEPFARCYVFAKGFDNDDVLPFAFD